MMCPFPRYRYGSPGFLPVQYRYSVPAPPVLCVGSGSRVCPVRV